MYSAVIGGLVPKIRCKRCRNSAGPRKTAEAVLFRQPSSIRNTPGVRGWRKSNSVLGSMTFCRSYRRRERLLPDEPRRSANTRAKSISHQRHWSVSNCRAKSGRGIHHSRADVTTAARGRQCNFPHW